MSFESFGKLIKEQRLKKEGTIYELGKLAGVSNTYISQIENGKKIPSKKVFFLLTHFLGIHIENGDEFQVEMLRKYAEIKDIKVSDLSKQFFTYIDEYIEEKMKPLTNLSDDFSNNRIKINKGTLETERIDKPYFDLNWLLTQKEYEVLYHRDYDIQKTTGKKGMNTIDKLMYNRLTDIDIKTIREMIEAYISNKYRKFPDRKE